jgi:preprotein translocase subunit YajC
MFNHLMILLAQAQGGQPPAGGQPQGGLFDSPIMFLLPVGIVLFYFLFLRPMRRQEQERNALLTNIKKNDKVITTAGIYAKVISVAEKEDEIVVEIDDKVRVKMVKNSILRNITNEETAKEADAAKKAAKEAAKAAKKAAKGGKAEEPAGTGITAKETRVTTKEGGA